VLATSWLIEARLQRAASVKDERSSRSGRRWVDGVCVLGELGEGGAQDPGDVHLGVADAPADFGLGEVLAEA
jgi:hypothetical protein